ELEFDGSQAARTDDVADTIDYAELAERMEAKAAEKNYNLLEALAEDLLEEVLADGRAVAGTVSIDKRGAITAADSVTVIASRRRGPATQTDFR
ncbi:MAG TPA: FolB domain-containing protein, partial [Phycisphaerae bacterium]|nr:FolB domain-containing protein [Phycisphaerae bacterium]